MAKSFIVEHSMSEAEFEAAIEKEGRRALAERLTGHSLQGCLIAFQRRDRWVELAVWADASTLKPKDGEIVIVFNGHDRVDREGEPAFDLDTYWEGMGWGNTFDGFRCKQDEPTHWMRIPTPPPRGK